MKYRGAARDRVGGRASWKVRRALGRKLFANTNDLRPANEQGPVAADESKSDQGGGGLVDQLDGYVSHLDDLDATWRINLDEFLQKRTNRVPSRRTHKAS